MGLTERFGPRETLMKPAPFHYHAPKTVDEAVALLAEVAPADGRVLAGGQSLVPTMAFRLARPAHLVDINGIAELDRIMVADGRLAIGACVRHAAFYRPVAEGPLGRLLASVVRHIAHHPIRTRGTFCGSLVNADPASEWCLVAATLGAEMVAQSRRGRRVIAAADFFAGIMTTELEEDELLVEARLPLLPADTQFGFYEFSRRGGDFAIAMALATYRIKDGRMVEPRLGVGGAEPKPRRMTQAERMLERQKPGPDAFARAAEAAAGAVEPMDDSNYSADYRRDLVRTVTRRALDHAARGQIAGKAET
jgi:carbon-monoxide dehydrogenase medium subunit